jgi:hypothetical protein
MTAIVRGRSAARIRPTTSPSTIHHAVEPRNTPNANIATPPADSSAERSSTPATMAVNDRIVAGFTSVSPSVEAKAARWSRGVALGFAFAAALSRMARTPSAISAMPPTTCSGSARRVTMRSAIVSAVPARYAYTASATAAPRPEQMPLAIPFASVRRMQSSPIGPIGAATAHPIATPRTSVSTKTSRKTKREKNGSPRRCRQRCRCRRESSWLTRARC